jgi:hypothetical protein
MLSQMQELTSRVAAALPDPWAKKRGRRKSCGLYQAVEVACMYIRHNCTQEFLGDLRGISQPTVSRIITKLVPVVKAVLEEFVPDAKEAIELVKGRVCLVDGTITPCWSYRDHDELKSRKKGITGFNAQFICLLDGSPVYISDPLNGSVHDCVAYEKAGLKEIAERSGGGIGDKGYQGTGVIMPKKKPKGGELSNKDKESNANISALRAPVEQFIAHFKTWRIFHTDYRRPYSTYHDTFGAGRGLFFFSLYESFE